MRNNTMKLKTTRRKIINNTTKKERGFDSPKAALGTSI